ncbi:hypothetical protein PO878_00990 [Iamia majanohamensis]|uniref:Uncharacterized protein n=1 Tax=Iamia majanohamensis TaxID=467976 RepID=A0AAE9Y5Q5_9ACTN|nr:hypothetical protein [Iamia majanohamensis]WCO67295.1 hypothetical protein PO878_00990 [Iamia majanohamensis]
MSSPLPAPAAPQGNETCVLHPFEVADRLCHQCGRWHCDGCLVAPWGPRKPVLCVECAIGRGGVRRSAGAAPVRTPREIRQLEKDARRQSREDSRRPVVVTPKGLARDIDAVVQDRPERRSLLKRLRPG